MAILPPGIGAEEFQAVTRALEDAVGRDWVFTSDEGLTPYRDCLSTVWGASEERPIAAAVAPVTVE